jgi:membrane fusion protein (multidrug efflux system)
MYSAISIYKTIRLTLALALSMTLTACLQQENQINKEIKKTEKRINYPTASVQFINPEYEISIPAELRPYEQVAVFAKVSGFVKKLYVDRGDHVRKGQLLAVLEAPEMNQRYLSDKATEQKIYSDYLFARQAYDRLKDASTTSGAIAAIELERAKSNV